MSMNGKTAPKTQIKLDTESEARLKEVLKNTPDLVPRATSTIAKFPTMLRESAIRSLADQVAKPAPTGKILAALKAERVELRGQVNVQINAIMQAPKFQSLERRNLQVERIVLNRNAKRVRFKLLNVSRQKLLADMQAADGDNTRTKYYLEAVRKKYHTPGETPYTAAFIGGTFGPNDVPLAKSMLLSMSESHTLTVSQADASLFTHSDSYRDLPLDERLFGTRLATDEMTEIRGLQNDPALATQLVLTTVPFLGRKPWHPTICPAPKLSFFDEDATDPANWRFVSPGVVAINRIVESLARNGIAGEVAGVTSGKEDVPVHVAKGEAVLLQRRVDEKDEKAFDRLGFVSTVRWAGQPHLVQFTFNTVYLPSDDLIGAARDKALLARDAKLVLLRNRIGHRLKHLLRLYRGTTTDPKKLKTLIEGDLKPRYCTGDAGSASQEELARKPLKNVVVTVTQPTPGVFHATVTLYPHVAASEFHVSIELSPDKP